ncbi:hypothetical protein F4820DRAFT_444384 [Hypoxylon rubiginosum]|uniref:Uncharacterized protein n=1 Tax=Hypoxylon rubiginosum TaxID=110542 RepID=A0ACB9ZE44_9PEZI|nr:hypothetical protein F4820DRAFT_444384 [Hypoxylon rubiginosum]
MKKFGFGKKQSDGGDDANRSALFGKKGSPGPASDNPYAQSQPANDPYMNDTNKYAHMTPYQKARTTVQEDRPVGLPSGPGPRSGYGGPALARNPSSTSSATTLPPYSNANPTANQQPSSGYSNDRYGTSSGYGTSKYTSNSYGGGSNTGGGRSGGYGGLGRVDSNSTDANRDALFSGVQERNAQKQQDQPDSYGASGVSGADPGASKYGGYGEQRELTAEEKDYEEYKNIKQEIRDTTKASVQSTENSMRALNQSLELSTQTYARLGGQNERLHETEQTLDRGVENQRYGDAQTKKLKTLNRSMFAVHVKNPFTEKRKTAEEEAKILSQSQYDREVRDSTRRDRYAQNARMESAFRDMNLDDQTSSFSKPNRNDRNKYTLEDDSDEEGANDLNNDNDQIDNNLHMMHGGVVKLNRIAKAMGDELDHGNGLIDRIGSKTESLDDRLKLTTRTLKKMNGEV